MLNVGCALLKRDGVTGYFNAQQERPHSRGIEIFTCCVNYVLLQWCNSSRSAQHQRCFICMAASGHFIHMESKSCIFILCISCTVRDILSSLCTLDLFIADDSHMCLISVRVTLDYICLTKVKVSLLRLSISRLPFPAIPERTSYVSLPVFLVRVIV